MKTKKEMLEMLALLTDESLPYEKRLEAYEYLLEDCDEVVEEMLEKFYTTEGDTNKMLIEILAGYKGNPAVYMGLVSCLYRGEDVALFARLLGSYGDERAIDVLKSFAEEYELNYNEYMEVRNAVEELGGDWTDDTDFSAATGRMTPTSRTTPSTATSKGWTSPRRTAAAPHSRTFSRAKRRKRTRTTATTPTAAAIITTVESRDINSHILSGGRMPVFSFCVPDFVVALRARERCAVRRRLSSLRAECSRRAPIYH